jgi:hypothetical protein
MSFRKLSKGTIKRTKYVFRKISKRDNNLLNMPLENFQQAYLFVIVLLEIFLMAYLDV